MDATQQSRRARPWIALAWHGTLLLLAAVFLQQMVPTVAGMYEAFGGVLPLPTRLLITFTDDMLRAPVLFIALAFVFLVADGAVLHTLSRRPSLILFRSWSFAVTGIFVILYIFMALALRWPQGT